MHQGWRKGGVVVALSEQDMRVRVVILDDQVLLAEALHSALTAQDGINVVATATQQDRGLEMIAATAPDVVIVDHRPPELDGPRVAQAIWQRWPDVKTVMLVDSEAPGLLAQALDAGCSALFAKDRPITDLINTVSRANRGECVLRTDDLRHLVGRGRAPATPRRDALTERELTVLGLVAKAQSISAISAELFVSPHTVRHHIQNILRKLGAHSRLEAVAIAIRDGIMPLAEMGSRAPEAPAVLSHAAAPGAPREPRPSAVVHTLRPADRLCVG
jgi:two-component system response regulator DevR